MDTAAAVQPCPTCSESLPVLPGYLTWCHACGWNLAPPPRRESGRGAVERVRSAAGRRLGTRLAEQLLAAPSLEPRLTPARAAAYAIAVSVHLTTVALAVGGVALAALTFPNVIAIVVGAVMIGAAWLMRPRLGKPPTKGVLGREEAPGLYGVADDVAAALGTRPVDLVVVNASFNAWWSVVGLRRRRVLGLGLPLVTSLRREELVALVGHELAHARNGDAQRTFLVSSAVSPSSTRC